MAFGGVGEKLLVLAFATWNPGEKLEERQLEVKALRLGLFKQLNQSYVALNRPSKAAKT